MQDRHNGRHDKYRLEELLHTEVDVIHGPLEEGSLIAPGKVVPLYESQG